MFNVLECFVQSIPYQSSKNPILIIGKTEWTEYIYIYMIMSIEIRYPIANIESKLRSYPSQFLTRGYHLPLRNKRH